ncbi:hypothetical protein [Microbispora amethystogenes]|uniref:Guanylate cyclase domain-containing protein n=1 Tax=Microbispora amethystogenes TaxID=1427754 RepID=A0ABQ4F9T9_9ACTN|nr:hypothetical protein [Microbispora amethystogenes]GIH31553.1 hypothetical protein Mam01_17170 [Microbispora amethystogenes]
MGSADFGRRLLVAADAEGYGRGDDMRHEAVQSGLVEVLQEAAAEAGLSMDRWSCQEQGDGRLCLPSPDDPELRVVDDFVWKLEAALRRHNRHLRDEVRLRLRLAMHHGVVVPGRNGYVGQAAVTVCRLLDANEARRALASAPQANLVVVFSERIFEDVVAQGHTGYRPGLFTEVTVRTKERDERAWMLVPERSAGSRTEPMTGAAAPSGSQSKGVTMDTGNLQDVADALWPVIAAGGLERVGAYGTEAAVAATGGLLDRLRRFRKEKGKTEQPYSREELYRTLQEMVRDDALPDRLLRQFAAQQIAVNLFHAPVNVTNGTIGIGN